MFASGGPGAHSLPPLSLPAAPPSCSQLVALPRFCELNCHGASFQWDAECDELRSPSLAGWRPLRGPEAIVGATHTHRQLCVPSAGRLPVCYCADLTAGWLLLAAGVIIVLLFLGSEAPAPAGLRLSVRHANTVNNGL